GVAAKRHEDRAPDPPVPATPPGSTSGTLERAGLLDGHGHLLCGLATALIWGVHDRLAEPVFSIASLNHSLTFTLYLAAMLALMAALRGVGRQDLRGGAGAGRAPTGGSRSDQPGQVDEGSGSTASSTLAVRSGAGLVMLAALLSYEVAVSLLPVAVLLILIGP